ncbi:MAG: DNA translocase FtsK [Cytophagaceae bacterium]|jgi:S-DNA-T family DNA segregation ATPase FtsK/SpoIIIE|nr:DNA translocase FtsK [Cytophagaceae bacterium]
MADKPSKNGKNGKSKTSKKNLFAKIRDTFKNDMVKFITGIVLVAFTFFLLVAFLSFFKSGHADSSKLGASFFSYIFNSNIKVENVTGKWGAWFADVLINRWFGIASVSIIFLTFIVGLRLLGARLLPLRKTFFHAALITIWTSTTLGFFFLDSLSDKYLLLGGAHGFHVSEWMKSSIGWVGTLLIILLTFIIYTAINFGWFLGIFKKKVNDKKSKEKKEKPAEGAGAVMNKTEPVTTENEEEIVESKNHPVKTNDNKRNEQLNGDHSFTIETAAKEELWKPNDNQPNNQLDVTIVKAPLETYVPDEEENLPQGDYDPTLELSSYKLPEFDLLEDHSSEQSSIKEEELIANKNKIVKTLEDFKIEIKSIKATVGPTVTLYEIVPIQGVRISRIKNLEDDIALSLAALGIRIIAPIPGKGTIGIEVPNSDPEIVSMKSIITSRKFQNSNYELPIALGKTISNETFVMDLAKTPHMLVAGATGQGKSVGLNAILTSLLYKKHPSQLKFVMVDPKKVEFSIYSKIERHFLAKLSEDEEPIITDVQRVVSTLHSLTVEMDERYDLLKKAHTRNIKEYNAKFISRSLNPEKGHRFLPYIVVVIDEFGDLIMTAGKEVELPIARIAQLARAVGIHMIIATQRPSTNIITGVIKANFPTRVAFRVSSMIDSRTILDSPGANQLIGRGDMLISQGSELVRVQCAFVDTPEVERIVDFIGSQRGYATALILPEAVGDSGGQEIIDLDPGKRDSMFEEAARVVVANQSGSTSLIQRRFSIGYNRAGRIMDQLETAGVVGPAESSKPRQVMILDEFELDKLFERLG